MMYMASQETLEAPSLSDPLFADQQVDNKALNKTSTDKRHESQLLLLDMSGKWAR